MLHGDLPFKRKDKAYYLVVIEDKPVVVQNRLEVFPVVTHTTFESDNTDKQSPSSKRELNAG